MVDILTQINAVHRELTTRDVDGAEARVLGLRQAFDTDEEDLWDAVTSAERIPRWLLPISGDLRVGGRYQLEGNAGGEILVCDAPHHVAVTWEFGGQVSWVDVRLTAEAEGRTVLELEHTAPVDPAMWAEFGPGAVGLGWDSMLLGLALHVAGGSLGDGVDPMVWLASDEGRAFLAASSDRWQAADISTGTPPEQATAAAGRVLAAYTATPDA